jgi:thioesterase domain-containing protein
MTKHLVAPRDVFELRLSQIWADVLRRNSVGVKSDFFALNGDRGMAQAVLAAIATQFDTALSLETFVEGPTIERLACHLRKQSKRLHAEPLVPLQPNGSKRPFFFLPGDGNVFNFHDLAHRMAPDQPLYGLQARGMHGEQPPHDHVEDMAAAFIESVRAVQPRGPYLLGGHCTGAMVALEMALQLQRRGEQVAMLVAVEASAPAVFRLGNYTMVDDPIDFYIFYAGGFRSWLGKEMRVERNALLACDPSRRAGYFMDLARKLGVYVPDAPDDHVDHVLALYRLFCRKAYVPADIFAGPITFVRGRDSNFCETATGGWEDVSAQPLRIREIPGNHCTVLTEPNVGLLTHELRAAIAEASQSR